jgi:uncharacterized cupredoxin-like copper-binding protein
MPPVLHLPRVGRAPIQRKRGKMRRKTRFPLAASAMAILAVSIGACGGGDDNKSSTPAASDTTSSGTTTINASLGEYFIKLDKSSVPKGQVQFSVSNVGKIKHEFVVLKTNLAPGKLPVKGGEANEDVGPSPGEIPNLPSGKKKTLAVKLSPGKYVLICNLPGHYKAGQYIGLSVK